MNDPLVYIWDKYGWIGFLGYVMVREVWPFVSMKLWPAKVAQIKAERQRVAKLEERQMELDERQVASVDAISQSVQQMALAIVANNERLSQLIAGHSVHAQESTNAIALMRERTGFEERRKSRAA